MHHARWTNARTARQEGGAGYPVPPPGAYAYMPNQFAWAPTGAYPAAQYAQPYAYPIPIVPGTPQMPLYGAQPGAFGAPGAFVAPPPAPQVAHGSFIPPLERPLAALAPVSIQQPALLTTFSYDEHKTLLFDDSAKRWYHDPPTATNSAGDHAADLNYGFEHFHDKPHIPDPLDSVLYTLMQRAKGAPDRPAVDGTPIIPAQAVDSEILRMNVVTWRGIMTKLCTAWSLQADGPPQFRQGFELNAMMAPPLRPPPVAPSGSRTLRAQYYDTPEAYSRGGPPGWGGDVDLNVQWCHVVKTKLGDARIVLGGEVDCVEQANGEQVVELKTSTQPAGPRDETMLRIKMLRMCAYLLTDMQSFLLGVRTLVIGFRNAQGTLLDHRRYRTTDIPRLVRDQPGQWNANDNLAFGAHIIAYLRRAVAAHTEQWLMFACDALRMREAREGSYPWRVHRATGGFLSHLPLPAASEAEYEYPVFRVCFEPPFSHVTIRRVPLAELAQDGRRAGRCGIVPRHFYEWVTEPMEKVDMYM